MARKKIETLISEKIKPFLLNEKDKASIIRLENQYPYNLLVQCISISASQYLKYDENTGEVIEKSIDHFIDKIGGIAYNKSLAPIDQEISHLKHKGKSQFNYWDDKKANELLYLYVDALYSNGWSEDKVLSDLRNDSSRMLYGSRNWSDWEKTIEQWIIDIHHWKDNDTTNIDQSGTVLPEALFLGVSKNFASICKQINASYENNLYDCAAVMMRRLLEGLLVLAFQNADIESEIMDNSGIAHVSLDKMIRIAEQNNELALSSNTKRDMSLFKDLGNYSAHKIWYNCTQGDLKPHLLKYRAIIEELMYKSGMKTKS